MSPAELSSIKWEEDGEMSAQDTWSLVKKLTKVEEQDKASNLLHLSLKVSQSQAWRKVQILGLRPYILVNFCPIFKILHF